jgi:hypothetical protein
MWEPVVFGDEELMSRLISGRTMSFRYEALLYAGEAEFVERAGAFLCGCVEAGEPALVVVDTRKIGLRRQRLDGLADSVLFANAQTRLEQGAVTCHGMRFTRRRRRCLAGSRALRR